MTRHVRRGLIGLMALLIGLFVAGPASANVNAAPTPAPSPCETARPGYAAPGVCQLVAHVAVVCEADVPQVRYALDEQGTTLTKATITWVNPSGQSVVLADQPLSGTLVWPGTVFDTAGHVVDWPGWTKHADGTWTTGDEFSWARNPVKISFEVNPSTVAVVSYPAVSSGCAPVSSAVLAAEDVTRTSTPTRSAVLAATGSDIGPLALGGAGLVLLGGLLVILRASRRAGRHTRRSTT